MKNVVILGSTGSIGVNSLQVISNLKGRFAPYALFANKNWKALSAQIKKFHPAVAGLMEEECCARLKAHIGRTRTEIVCGPDAVKSVIAQRETDIVLSAISGSAGLPASICAVEHGKRLALANKESIVMAGGLLMRKAQEHNAEIIPVDSEHSAVFQCLHAGNGSEVRRVILTASGGPFLKTPKKDFPGIKPAQALRHPTWSMGPKITVDSATLMNKALEMIEAHYLFGLDAEKIKVVIHPQSVIHSMVEYVDGSVMAQMSLPDMRLPVQYALTYPERVKGLGRELDFAGVSALTFEEPDTDKFVSIKLAYGAIRQGGLACVVLNAGNETAVNLFLTGKITFDRIFTLVEKVLSGFKKTRMPEDLTGELGQIMYADAWARKEILKCLY